MTTTNDHSIIERLNAGDETVLKELFLKYEPRLRGFASIYIPDYPMVVADIVQDCFITLWERRTMISDNSLRSMLFKMVRNSCLNHIKHLIVGHHYTVNFKNRYKEQLYNLDLFSSADHQLLYEELQEEIEKVVDTLPDKQREIFKMSKYAGLSNKEIAKRMDLSVGTVEKHLAKTMQLLRKHLQDVYHGNMLTLAILLIDVTGIQIMLMK